MGRASPRCLASHVTRSGTGDFRSRPRTDAVRHGPLPSPDRPVAGRKLLQPADSLCVPKETRRTWEASASAKSLTPHAGTFSAILGTFVTFLGGRLPVSSGSALCAVLHPPLGSSFPKHVLPFYNSPLSMYVLVCPTYGVQGAHSCELMGSSENCKGSIPTSWLVIPPSFNIVGEMRHMPPCNRMS